METDLDLDAKAKKLEDLIAAQEAFLAQKEYRDLETSLREEIDDSIDRITKHAPETIGQFFAHFVDIGRLAGLRRVVEQPHDLLRELRMELSRVQKEL